MAMPLFSHASAALSTPPRRVRVHLQLPHVSLRSEDFRRLCTGPVSWERLRAITACISLPIRPINFQYPEFQAVGREKYPTPAIARFLPATLTRVSADAGFPLRRHAV